MTRGWVVLRDGAAVTLGRPGALRADVSAGTVLPLDPGADAERAAFRLAGLVRQDLWRALRAVRGFSPVIRVEVAEGALRVEAGGALRAGPAPAGTAGAIAALLADPALRRRWRLSSQRPPAR